MPGSSPQARSAASLLPSTSRGTCGDPSTSNIRGEGLATSSWCLKKLVPPERGLPTLQGDPQLLFPSVVEGSTQGHLGGSAIGSLPSAQGMILESRDRVPHRAPLMEPASPSACVSASLSLSLCIFHEKINKILKINK